MNINHDYREVLKRGKWIQDRATFRNQQKAGGIVAICLMLSTLIVVVGILISVWR